MYTNVAMARKCVKKCIQEVGFGPNGPSFLQGVADTGQE